MSSAWHQIREHLMQSSSTLTFQYDFDEIRRRRPDLYRFRDPAALLDALHHGSDRPEQKNRVLTGLVREAQSESDAADIALALMLLALWPGLDAIRRRLKWQSVGALEDLPSEILTRATDAIRRLDLHRVSRIAATVLMNIERDLRRNHLRDVSRQRLHVETDPDEIAIDERAWDPADDVQRLQEDVARMIGDDAPLVIRVAVEGFTQAEVAEEFGLTEAATRKRYQRARRRLRGTMQVSSGPMSRLDRSDGFSGLKVTAEGSLQ